MQPRLNAHYDGATETLTTFDSVHLGVATQTDHGLLVPVIRNVEARGLWDLAAELTRMATAARDGSATREELTGSTITLEGLGTAAWWLDLADLVFDSRERAYRLYLARGERAAAARVAVWLAWDSWAFRGENAVANGWLQRARRLLEDHPPCPERAWLEVREGSL